MTHDLLKQLFEAVGAEVTDIVIDDLREGTFFAKVRYVHNDAEGQLDARPSDAVALAVRTDAPIFVVSTVLEEAGIPAEDEGPGAHLPEPEEAPEPRVSTGGTLLERKEAQLQKAIDEEDYETAARLRDEIARMKQEN
jgi:bifunctional DNase/RNase